MATHEHYDVVVLGSSIAGLLSGALLAQAGQRVCVLPLPTPQDRARYEPPLFGLRTSQIVKRALDQLGLLHALRTKQEGEPKALTVALPDRRFVLPSDLSLRGRVLGAVFPNLQDELLLWFEKVEQGGGESRDSLFMMDAPPEGWFARRKWKKQESARTCNSGETFNASPLIAQFVQAVLDVSEPVSRLSPGDSISLTTARAFWQLCYGVAPLRGGRAMLSAMITDKLSLYGGVLDQRHVPKSLEISKSFFGQSVQSVILGDDSRYTASVVLFAGDDLDLKQLWPDAPEPVLSSGFVRKVRVPFADRPVDLQLPCAFVDPDGRSAVVSSAEDDSLLLRWRGEREDCPDLEMLTPFARMSVGEPIWSPFIAGESLDELGLYRRSMKVSPFKNLIRLGASVLPGLGLEADCLTAHQAALMAASLCPKHTKGR